MKKYIFIFFIIVGLSTLAINSDKKEPCEHCNYVEKNQERFEFYENQPVPYIHDKDSSLIICPILDNEDSKTDKRISEIKIYYKDNHFCSTLTNVIFVMEDSTYKLTSLRNMSCKIVSYIKIPQENPLKTKQINKIIIENISANTKHEYILNNKNYFIETYKNIY